MSNIYLGIDYGLAHIGVAYSEYTLATPLPILPNDDSIFSHLSTLISKYHITHIILGLPSGPVEVSVRTFAQKLESETSLPVIFHDETLSSHEAKAQLLASGVSQSRRRDEHSVAAALILEDYLESVNMSL